MRLLSFWSNHFLLKKNVKLSTFNFSVNIRDRKCHEISRTMKVLNVAEKNDAAKNIAGLLSRGNANRREGFSKFNKIYEFNINLWNQNCIMIMTSVSGHLMSFDFVGAYRKWTNCHPLSLFDAPVVKSCTDDSYMKIKTTLEKEAKGSDALIIWTDCDREGENIGYEIIQVCQAVKPNMKVYRAVFSEITQTSVTRAIQTLSQPNKAISDAVDVRSELDLRIGAAFTRFQTLRLQKVFPVSLNNMLISYGSCQFPTLGFVVERFLAIEKFIPEPYWKLRVTDHRDEIFVEFRWARHRLFEKINCQVLLDKCEENPDATVEKVKTKPKSKWRPLPLDTIELEKLGSKKLKLNAKETMKIAEKLYTQGFISYPRTETNIFPKELNLQNLVQQQVNHHQWGPFAQRVLNEGITPRQGKKTDHAHPPIHPTKFDGNLEGNEGRVYEFIVRHFLACISKDAEGYETTVEIDIAGEKFTANGLQIVAKNYLDVYIYEKWNAKEIHIYEPRQVFRPTSIDMVEEKTSPPNLLTEADLIALMDKHGIGTDATHAEHIETIKSRQYVGLKDNQYFMPGKLGIGLVMGYDNMGFQMSKPNLRAELENDLKLICNGEKNPEDVLQTQINKYRDVFRIAIQNANLIDTALSEYIDETPSTVPDMEMITPPEENAIYKCPKCGLNMTLKVKKQGGKYIGCMGFPSCNNAVWLPEAVTEVEVTNEICNVCPGNMKKLRFKLRPGAFPLLGSLYSACLGGCDMEFNEILRIDMKTIRRTQQLSDSGYSSINNTTNSQTNFNSSFSTNTNYNPRGNMGTQNNRPPSTQSNRGWGDANNSSHRNDFGAKRQNDGWSNQEYKRPRESSMPNNIGRENMNPGLLMQNTGNNSNEGVKCSCGRPAKIMVVKKDSENKGRYFYKCPQGPSSPCLFFQWADEVNASNSNYNNQWNNAPIRGQHAPRGASRAPGAKRKCGICGVEGHTKRTCPQNAMD